MSLLQNLFFVSQSKIFFSKFFGLKEAKSRVRVTDDYFYRNLFFISSIVLSSILYPFEVSHWNAFFLKNFRIGEHYWVGGKKQKKGNQTYEFPYRNHLFVSRVILPLFLDLFFASQSLRFFFKNFRNRKHYWFAIQKLG